MYQKITLLHFLLLFCFISLPEATKAQDTEFINKFTKVLEGQYSKFSDVIPGLSVAIVKDNKIIFSKAVGYADIKGKVLADTQTIYYTASCTKPFTGTLAALLNSSQKINLDEKFTKYLSGIKFSDDSIYLAEISVKELLTHSSGLVNDPLVFGLAYSGKSSNEEIIPVLENGTKYKGARRIYNYSNLGYNIYSIMMKKHLAIDWRDMLEKEIFTRLEMKDSYIYYSKLIKDKKTLAVPYSFSIAGPEQITQMKIDNTIHSAGGIFSTPSDMAKFLLVHLNGGKISNQSVFDKQVINETQKMHLVINNPPKRTVESFKLKGHGIGWRIGTYNKDSVFYYTGSYPGALTEISFIPEKKLGVVVMSNEMFAGFLADLLTTYVYDWFSDKSTADSVYAAKENQLLIMKEQMQKANKDHNEKLKSRTWQLELPMNNYAGEYYNELYGNLTVTIKNGNLCFKIGNIENESTPFEDKNSARVELELGAGKILSFSLNDKRVVSFTYNNYEFKKIK